LAFWQRKNSAEVICHILGEDAVTCKNWHKGFREEDFDLSRIDEEKEQSEKQPISKIQRGETAASTE